MCRKTERLKWVEILPRIKENRTYFSTVLQTKGKWMSHIIKRKEINQCSYEYSRREKSRMKRLKMVDNIYRREHKGTVLEQKQLKTVVNKTCLLAEHHVDGDAIHTFHLYFINIKYNFILY